MVVPSDPSAAPGADLGGCQADPRPDIWWDSVLWGVVLTIAIQLDTFPNEERSLYGLLHGLRCGGARLVWSKAGRLRLDYSPLVKSRGWSDSDLRQNWLAPLASAIKAVFSAVEEQAGARPHAPALPLAAGF